MGIPLFGKFSVVALMVSLALGFGLYERRKYESWRRGSLDPILKAMPDFRVEGIVPDGPEVVGEELLAAFERGLFVHFWGTWCGPCEAELPELIDFAREYEGRGVGLLLLAVKDEDTEIEKFMGRFRGDFPENIVVAHDREGLTLKEFGTVKVPETYLFRPNGQSVTKFVGPQNWGHASYKRRIDLSLALHNAALESH